MVAESRSDLEGLSGSRMGGSPGGGAGLRASWCRVAPAHGGRASSIAASSSTPAVMLLRCAWGYFRRPSVMNTIAELFSIAAPLHG